MRRAALLAATILLTACSSDPASPPLLSVVITAPKQTIAVGETVQLTAIARDVNGLTIPTAQFTYTVSPPSVLDVSASGLVTGVAVGTGTITATSGTVTSPPFSLTVN
jgi:uncharacterized protein YjdB